MAEEVVKTAKRPRGRPRKTSAPLLKNDIIQGVKCPSVRRQTKPSAPDKEIVQPSITVAAPLKYIFAVGRRKRAVARVFVYHNGKGEIEINDRELEKYFSLPVSCGIVKQPLDASPFRHSVRVVVKVRGGGLMAQSEAVRLGIARALMIIDGSLRQIFRAKGYVTRDPREKERKKPGLKKARRAPQWQKR